MAVAPVNEVARLAPSFTPERAIGQLTAASAQLLLCPAGGHYIIKTIELCDNSGAGTTATLRHIESGGPDTLNRNFLTAQVLAANETIIVDYGEGKHMSGSDQIKGLAGVAGRINVFINYLKEV